VHGAAVAKHSYYFRLDCSVTNLIDRDENQVSWKLHLSNLQSRQ